MNCEAVRAELSLYVYGELSFDQEEALEQHLEQCAPCRLECDKERRLHVALDMTMEQPPPAVLAQCRRDLFAHLDSRNNARAVRPSLWQTIAGAFSWHAAWLKPAGALALLAIGFFGGRLAQTQQQGGEALSARQPAEVMATRVRNVEPDSDGRVRIVFDETRQRTVSGAANDERIRALLLAAAQDQADPGLRVESVGLLQKESSDKEVRQALLQALERDNNPGVRMKALEGLRPYAGDAQVRRTLAQVLLRDDNAGLRTQAIDLLTQHRQSDMVGVLQELMQKEENDYIRLRTQRALREMKASVDTF